MSSELQNLINSRLGRKAEFKPNQREANIIRHYDDEIAKEHFTLHHAADRVIGDLNGENRAKAKSPATTERHETPRAYVRAMLASLYNEGE